MLTVPLWGLTIAGFLGDRWWVFDLAANVRPQLALLLGLAAVMLFMMMGAGRSAILAALGAAINLAVLLPFLVGGASPPDPDSTHLELSFLNVKIGAADQKDVVAYLATRDDDVVILSAGTRRWVEALTTNDTGLHVVEGPRRSHGTELIVLTRDPTTRVTVIRPMEGSRSALVDFSVQFDDQDVRVLGTHPVSPLSEERAARRDAQFAWIADWARRQDAPSIVVGDLNAAPWSPRFRALLDHGGLQDSRRGHGWQASWPAPWGPLGLPLDHVLHTPDLTAVERQLGPSFGSDHRMVHVRLARSQEPSR